MSNKIDYGMGPKVLNEELFCFSFHLDRRNKVIDEKSLIFAKPTFNVTILFVPSSTSRKSNIWTTIWTNSDLPGDAFHLRSCLI